MKSFSISYALPVASLAGLMFVSCETINSPQPIDKPSITYTVSGGFTGGLWTKLMISSTGIATLETTYPPLELQLSSAEHTLLLDRFANFRDLPGHFPNQCRDGLIFSIELKGDDYTKQIAIDECTLYSQKNSNATVAKISALVQSLESLRTKVYELSAPWKGLTVDFSIDSDIYGLGEPIVLRYRISNPTSIPRALYFQHQSQFWFGLGRYNFPGFHYFYPVSEPPDSSDPSQILFDPGQVKEITSSFDQRIQAEEGDTALGIGYFKLYMNLFAGDFPTKEIWFEVLDRNEPLGGAMVPDLYGESRDSPTYTFALSIRNWTTSSVTLHFPSSQTIIVEVFDLDKPTPGPLIYSGPPIIDSITSTITIGPGEFKTFTHLASKSDFVPWYMWTYARIRLTCTDFEFVRDGQLRIFRYP